MLILTIRTDTSETEIGLYEEGSKLAYHTWDSGRGLSVTLHAAILKLLNDLKKDWQDVGGIVVFKGPGSFTGLRIGLTVGNALAEGLSVPIVSTKGEDWTAQGLKRLEAGDDEKVAMPEYGAEPNISTPRK